MATNAVTGAPVAPPEPKHLNESRRKFLRAGTYAGGAAIVTVAGAGLAAAETRPTAIRPEFELKARHARRLKIIADRIYHLEVEPTHAEYEQRIAALPHAEVNMGFLGEKGEQVIFSTADKSGLAAAYAIVNHPQTPDSQIYRNSRKLVAADKWRERAKKRIFSQCGAADANDKSDRAGQLYYDAITAFAAMPSRSLAEIGMKLRTIEELDDLEAFGPDLIDDIRTLSAMEA